MIQIKFDTFKIDKMPELKLEQINCVYTGKPNLCMCGCSGIYKYTRINREISTKNRGYEVTDDEISDQRVKNVYAKFVKNTNSENQIEVIQSDSNDGWIFTKIVGKTQYTIYTN